MFVVVKILPESLHMPGAVYLKCEEMSTAIAL